MNTETNQGFLFGSEINPPVPWRTYATSMAVHVAGIVLLMVLVPILVTRRCERAAEAGHHADCTHAGKALQTGTAQGSASETAGEERDCAEAGAAKDRAQTGCAPARRQGNAETCAAATDCGRRAKADSTDTHSGSRSGPGNQPQVHTGVFGSEQAAKKVEAAKDLKVGGFGDPNGAKTSPETKNPTLMAKVGSFEAPQGEGTAGGRGGAGRGTVRQSSFGSMDGAGSGPGGNGVGIGHGTVRQSGFGASDGGGGNGTGAEWPWRNGEDRRFWRNGSGTEPTRAAGESGSASHHAC